MDKIFLVKWTATLTSYIQCGHTKCVHIMPGHHMLNVQVVFIISTLIPYLVIFTCYIQIVRTFKCSKRRLYQVSNFSNFNKADKVYSFQNWTLAKLRPPNLNIFKQSWITLTNWDHLDHPAHQHLESWSMTVSLTIWHYLLLWMLLFRVVLPREYRAMKKVIRIWWVVVSFRDPFFDHANYIL